MADRFGYGEIGLDINPCRGCEDYDAPDGCKSNGGCGRTQTNADRIRTMSDEELAKYLAWLEDEQACYQWEMYGDADRIEEWTEWLKAPVEVEE